MKILNIIYVENENSLIENIKKYNRINDTFLNKSVIIDNIIFYTDKINIGMIQESFENKVYLQKINYIIPDVFCKTIEEIQIKEKYNGIIMESSISNSISVMVGKKLKYFYATNIMDFCIKKNYFYFKRFAYNNNVYCEFKIENSPFVISVKMIKSYILKKYTVKPEIINLNYKNLPDYIIEGKCINKAQSKEYSNILIVVGKGVKDKKSVDKIREYTNKKNFLFGVTRPIAMNGWGKLNEIVGVSGNIYSPKICITIGVSGSAAFYVGIENSEYIISINSNENAPIVNISDVTIIDDYKNVIDEVFDIL